MKTGALDTPNESWPGLRRVIEPMEGNQMTASTSRLKRAFVSTRAILAEVQPEQLDNPTPCTSWDISALIDHFVGSARWGAATVGSGGDIPGGDSSDDYLTRYDAIIDAALAAFEAEGALDKMIDLPMGELSGADVLGIVTRDQFVHGWDLARAIGCATDLDPELAAELLTEAQVGISEDTRGPEDVAFFGPIVDAPAGASPADRLAAFLGRSL
jgi:uncharacterized protein (TIGR03086 family)